MSVSKWNYEPSKCDGQPCAGDCDFCDKTCEEWDDLMNKEWEDDE